MSAFGAFPTSMTSACPYRYNLRQSRDNLDRTATTSVVGATPRPRRVPSGAKTDCQELRCTVLPVTARSS